LALGRDLGFRIRHSIATAVARWPWLLARRSFVRLVADHLGGADPWQAIAELRTVLPADVATRLVLDPRRLPPTVLPNLMQVRHPVARAYAVRAAVTITREQPFPARNVLMRELLAGEREMALALLPEAAQALNLTEAHEVLAIALPLALSQLDPYAPGITAIARRAVVSILAVFPPLVDLVLGASSDPIQQATSGEMVIAATARSGLLDTSVIPRVAPLVAGTREELPERLRPADNRYSTADTLLPGSHSRRRMVPKLPRAIDQLRAHATLGFRARLIVLLALDVAAIWLAMTLFAWLEQDGHKVPTFGLPETLTAAAVLVALHVLAVELAAGSLGAGMLPAVAWPARLVSAYVVAAVFTMSAFVPDAAGLVSPASLAVLLIQFPFVAIDLVSKSDHRRAVERVARDRRADFSLAGLEAARVFGERLAIKGILDHGFRVRRASTEPVTRRRVTLRARRDGYAEISARRLADVDAALTHGAGTPLRTGTPGPSLVLLHDTGSEVMAGDPLAVLQADEPDWAEALTGRVEQVFNVRRLRAVDQARAAVLHLAGAHTLQSASDRRGAEMTSRRIENALRAYLRRAESRLGPVEPSGEYLANLLPFNPEIDAVFGLEAAWQDAILRNDDRQSEALRDHAVRLARLCRGSHYSSSLDVLLARIDVVGRDAPSHAVHSVAALLSELGGIAAEGGRRSSFFPARSALESMLDRLTAQTPIPREEELVRQRFEELLARAMIADYLMEVQVERGCQKLVSIASRAGATRRRTRVAFGLAKIGSAALGWRRLALAAKIAFLVRDTGVTFADIRTLAKQEDYRVRMTTLSTIAGEIFGGDVGDAVARYAEWAEELCSGFPVPPPAP
jgi:hypothetical protein